MIEEMPLMMECLTCIELCRHNLFVVFSFIAQKQDVDGCAVYCSLYTLDIVLVHAQALKLILLYKTTDVGLCNLYSILNSNRFLH